MIPARYAARAIPAGVERFPATDRAAWLARRQADVTASVIGALVGEHEFATLYQIWCLKAGLLAEDPTETAPMRRGRLLEPVAMQVLREDTGWDIEAPGLYYRDPAARIGCTPDGFAVDPERPGFGIIQFKSVESGVFRAKWKAEDGIVEPPIWIALQAIVEAVLTGASWAVVAPLIVGHGIEVHPIEVPVHRAVYGRLQTAAGAFWRSVASNTPPDPDFAADGATIAALYRDDNGQEIDLRDDGRLYQLAAERDDLKVRIKGDGERVSEIDAVFKHALGPHQAALIGGGRRATWRTERRRQRIHFATETRVLRISPASNRSL